MMFEHLNQAILCRILICINILSNYKNLEVLDFLVGRYFLQSQVIQEILEIQRNQVIH